MSGIAGELRDIGWMWGTSVTEKMVISEAERHRPQLETYAEALSRIYEKNVKEKYLYFFHLGELTAL